MKFRFGGRLLVEFALVGILASMVFLSPITTQAIIPEISEIHTAFLYYQLTAVPNSSYVLSGIKSFVPASNIVVIGVSLETEIYPNEAEVDSGAVIIRAEISRNIGFDQDGSILGIRTILLGKRVIIANYNDVAIGKPSDQASIIFPSGTGMRFSAGEPIYMNFYMANYWQRISTSYAYGIIYYIVG